VLESLIKSGAMDSLGRRAQLMAVLDRAMDRAQKTQRDAESGQHGLFGVFQQEEVPVNNDKLPNTPTGTSTRAWPPKKKSSDSSSPAIRWKNTKTSWKTCSALSIADIARSKSTGKDETICHGRHHHQPARAEVQARRFLRPSHARRHVGSVEMIVFPEAYRSWATK
jgi:DNA polymerase III alpha subunit